MNQSILKAAAGIAALAAIAFGASAIASGSKSSSTSVAGTGAQGAQPPGINGARPPRGMNGGPPPGAPGGPGFGRSVTGATAAKVKAAALAKVPGATVLETEAGGPYGSPYHAHVKASDGSLKVVLVNASFQATAVQADQGRGGGGRHGHDGRGGPGGETALTGATKDKVEAAVNAKYAGATIVRTESNGDSSAPYESHIKTSAGQELEVLVSKDFAVVDAREHPAHP
jgi:hypothetical protein